jgi:hypothetical protein
MKIKAKLFVYALCDPRTDEIRYIGKTCTGLQRIRDHFWACRKNKKLYHLHIYRWMRCLLKDGYKPVIKILKECTDENDLNESEISLIRYYRSIGTRLTNCTDGGDGGNTGMSWKRRIPVIAINLITKEEKEYDFVLDTIKDGFLPTKVV